MLIIKRSQFRCKYYKTKLYYYSISAYSGDIRKALDVCQRALVLAELEDIPLININLIFKILNEIQGSSVTAAIRNGSDNDLPLQQKLLVASLLLMSNHRKSKDNTLGT